MATVAKTPKFMGVLHWIADYKIGLYEAIFALIFFADAINGALIPAKEGEIEVFFGARVALHIAISVIGFFASIAAPREVGDVLSLMLIQSSPKFKGKIPAVRWFIEIAQALTSYMLTITIPMAILWMIAVGLGKDDELYTQFELHGIFFLFTGWGTYGYFFVLNIITFIVHMATCVSITINLFAPTAAGVERMKVKLHESILAQKAREKAAEELTGILTGVTPPPSPPSSPSASPRPSSGGPIGFDSDEEGDDDEEEEDDELTDVIGNFRRGTRE